ncbi:MAG TPA: NAD(P)H-dependent glycerol-3-phosphate dehydrogenase [Clostridiales bacterium UBA8960]|nr:NAD(P)H-dependent glycerol-3-phosphate dehydrogenase [Clostridiales bacterium UBA8960]
MKITVIAAGSWGTALSMVLNENGHDVKVWVRSETQVETIQKTKRNEKYLPGIEISEEIVFTSDKSDAIKDAEIIVFSVPSQQYKSTLEDFIALGLIRNDHVIVNVSKGIDMVSLETVSQITQRLLPEVPFVALSGPSHAEEVALKLPTALVSASKSRACAELIQDVISNDYIRVYTNPDVMGVEISGALKNIIALGAGISDGLGYGDNAKAALITRGIKEIATLGIAMGADMETFKGLAGVGDLIVTCTSMHSRNRRCGILIGQGHTLTESIDSVGMVVEGAYTVKAAHTLSQKYNLDMPITQELYRILYEDKNAREAVNHLMTRRRKHEMDEYATNLEGWI